MHDYVTEYQIISNDNAIKFKFGARLRDRISNDNAIKFKFGARLRDRISNDIE